MSCFAKGGGSVKTDRLIGILSYLLQKEQATAPELAERFEVSRRTILRDVDALGRAGIPIRTTQGVNGGISIMENYRLNRAMLTDAELQAILSGLRSLDSVSGTDRYTLLMEKCSAASSPLLPGDGRILIDLGSWQKASLTKKIEIIRGAMNRRCLLSFHYAGPGGDSDRSIEPYYLLFRWGDWYVWGFCRSRQDYRLFKLRRMTALAAGEAFPPREAPLPDVSDGRVFPENYRIIMKVPAKYQWRLTEEYGEASWSRTPEGDCLFSAGFTDHDQALNWVLSFQGRAELLEPAALREEMRKIGKKIARKHKT